MPSAASAPETQPGRPTVYLIDPILPTRTVNLIVGASGAGKTTLIFQWLAAWAAQRPFLGFAPTPALPVCYIAMDRTRETIWRTMDRLSIPRNAFPIHSLIEPVPGTSTFLPLTWGSVFTLGARADLIIVEAISRLVSGKGINDYASVAEMLCTGQNLAEKHNKTIIGTHHTAKAKEGQQYLAPRERVMGSGAWPAFSETNFVLEADPQDSLSRTLWILPRNAPESQMALTFKGGELAAHSNAIETPAESLAWDWVQEHGVAFSTDEFQEAMTAAAMSRATATRCLKKLQEVGMVQQLKRGMYERMPTQ